MSRSIPVQLGERTYAVQVGSGLLGQLGRTVASLRARAAVVITDSNVAALYGPRAVESLRQSGVSAELIAFPAGEANKTLATCSRLFDALFAVAPPVDRRTVIVALGGGVAGDVAGFVAATALRGLRFVQCPTTLLADVDSSVGGKTGVDHPAGKNLIGAFHQPSAVLINVDLLSTLTPPEFANGLAECVKHGVIGGAGFQPAASPGPAQVGNLCHQTLLDFLEENARAILARQGDVLEELVARNVAIKAAVVSADEREAGLREHLNFGHTIGHAVETFLGYGTISHGQAVALGLVAECALAVERGLVPAADARRVETLLSALGLPVRWKGLDGPRIWDIMLHDKKARAGQVRMVLPTRLGEVDVFSDITPQASLAAVARLGGG